MHPIFRVIFLGQRLGKRHDIMLDARIFQEYVEMFASLFVIKGSARPKRITRQRQRRPHKRAGLKSGVGGDLVGPLREGCYYQKGRMRISLDEFAQKPNKPSLQDLPVGINHVAMPNNSQNNRNRRQAIRAGERIGRLLGIRWRLGH